MWLFFCACGRCRGSGGGNVRPAKTAAVYPWPPRLSHRAALYWHPRVNNESLPPERPIKAPYVHPDISWGSALQLKTWGSCELRWWIIVRNLNDFKLKCYCCDNHEVQKYGGWHATGAPRLTAETGQPAAARWEEKNRQTYVEMF